LTPLTLKRRLWAQAAGVHETHEAKITDVTPLAIAIANGHNPDGIVWNFADDIRVGTSKAEDLQIRLALNDVPRRGTFI
jgi:hypothetical protein